MLNLLITSITIDCCTPEGVVVGFEEKVYMAEEGRARLELPVVVKEGQLTQRVTFLVTIEDRTTTGNTHRLIQLS